MEKFIFWGFVLGIAVVLVLGQNYTGNAASVVPECEKHLDCSESHHYCVWGECIGKIPSFPAIGEVKLYNNIGARVLPDEEGYHLLPTEALARVDVKADNQGEPFNIYVYSPHVAFGSRGNSENLRLYHSSGAADIGDAEPTYGISIHKQRFRDDFTYPFYFSPLSFPGEKFSIYVYMQEFDRGRGARSQIIEIPIKTTQWEDGINPPFQFGPLFAER